MGHILRGEVPMLSLGDKTDTYQQFMQRINRYNLAERNKRFLEMYGTPHEQETELLARMLLRFIRENEQDMPPVAKQLYHWE
jgi:parvulin-like peptidyl-prolyl isomerase